MYACLEGTFEIKLFFCPLYAGFFTSFETSKGTSYPGQCFRGKHLQLDFTE